MLMHNLSKRRVHLIKKIGDDPKHRITRWSKSSVWLEATRLSRSKRLMESSSRCFLTPRYKHVLVHERIALLFFTYFALFENNNSNSCLRYCEFHLDTETLNIDNLLVSLRIRTEAFRRWTTSALTGRVSWALAILRICPLASMDQEVTVRSSPAWQWPAPSTEVSHLLRK